MKIGLFGGSFNPAHQGHVYISQLAIEKLALDEIWWIPTSQNPFKNKSDYAPFAARFQGCLEIAKNHDKISIKNFEDCSFSTYELVKKILENHAEARFCWVMGADNFERFHEWDNFEKLIELIEFAVFSRENYLFEARKSKAFKLYQKIRRKKLTQKNEDKKNILPKFSFFKTKNYDISSSEIRARNNS